MATDTPALRVEHTGSVVVLTLDAPPVNALGSAMRRALREAVRDAERDPTIRGVVIAGAGAVFSGGADITELETLGPAAEPDFSPLLRDFERASVPIVAALHGDTVGGGLELALACRARVAAAGTRVGLPEVRLGMPPGAGGTQLLPRALELQDALAALRSGQLFRVGAKHLGHLVDRIVDTPAEVLSAAIELAGSDEVRSVALLRERPLRHPHAEGLLAFAADRTTGVEQRIVKLVLDGAVDVKAGFAAEQTAFRDLAVTTSAAAQRYLFFAERAAGRADRGAAGVVDRVAVIGSGTMGSGIAIAALATGATVTLIDTDLGRVHDAADRIRERLGDDARLIEDVDLTAAADADLVIEAVFENLDVKRDVFRALDEAVSPRTVLATNTSTLAVHSIASATSRPERVVGMHFFSPADVSPLVELIRTGASTDHAVATAQAFARRMGKTVVRSADAPGFIGNRLVDAYHRQAMQLLAEGITPQRIDAELEAWGMRMGPFRVMDLIGLDVLAAGRAGSIEDSDWALADRLVERGEFGRKSGAGWYRYPPGRRDIPNPEVAALLPEPREMDARDIIDRCVLALVDQGAAVLAEGVAERAGDIDVVYTTGYGFPRERGGPMFYADTVGIEQVVGTMRRFGWDPHPRLIERAMP